MSGYEIIWNDVSSLTIPEFTCSTIKRGVLGAHRGTFVEIAGRDGAWYFPEERGRRKISIECFILAESFPQARRDVFTEVANWLDINGETSLVLGDDPTVFYNAVLLDPVDPDEWRELGEFGLEFSAQPYSLAMETSAVEFEQIMDDEWSYNFDVMSHTRPVVEITNVSGGTITGFNFIMGSDGSGFGGYSLNYPGALADGATLNINSIGMAVLSGANDDVMLTGVYEPTDLLMTGVSGTFPIIEPGVVNMSIEGEDTGAEVEIRVLYRKRYRN